MARSSIRTQLALDEYARIMSIPGWAFNQVTHPDRIKRGICPEVTLQSGHTGDPNRIVGRDEIAQAIATAESVIARFLGYWAAPKWICDEKRRWPHRKAGLGLPTELPTIKTLWGYVIEGGEQAFELLVENALVLYSDEDGDNVAERATVIAELPYLVHDECEIVVVPHNYDPALYAIRPLGIKLTPTGCGIYTGTDFLCLYPGGIGVYSPSSDALYLGEFCVATITGWTWQFVVPSMWLTIDELKMNEVANFLSGQYMDSPYPGIYGYDILDVPGPYDVEYGDGVDIYRRYNDPRSQAQIVWNPRPMLGACETTGVACEKACQTGCITTVDERNGLINVTPAWYHADTCTFSVRSFYNSSRLPDSVRLWYHAGYQGDLCEECIVFEPAVAEAIARLANCYMAEAPCGCAITRERWEKDREEMSIDSTDMEMAQSAFGTTMRGAIFAHSIFKTLPPLGTGR